MYNWDVINLLKWMKRTCSTGNIKEAECLYEMRQDEFSLLLRLTMLVIREDLWCFWWKKELKRHCKGLSQCWYLLLALYRYVQVLLYMKITDTEWSIIELR